MDPSRAFWDITHYKENIGSFKIYFLSALFFGLIGIASFSHISQGPIGWASFYQGLAIFIMFFLFGFIYFGFFYFVSIKLFSFGANQSINLSKQLELRYGTRKQEEDEKKTQSQKLAAGLYISDIPEYLLRKSKKTPIMLYAFAPMLIALGLSAIIAWIGLPQVIGPISPETLSGFFNSPVWGIIDWIQVIFMIGWVPILMAIALRDVANSSTLRVYISSVIVSVILCFAFYFLRPTFLFQNLA